MAWLVIVNSPGCLPEGEPVECETYKEAQQVACGELWETAEQRDPERAVSDSAIKAIERSIMAAPEGEHAWTFLGLAHCIAREA